MPAVFVGHGSPMNTLENNRYTQAWRALGQSVPRPEGIVMVSAHWYIAHSAVTAMDQPRTIHDFYGFPPELFAFQYPAPGAPELASRVAQLAEPNWVGLDADQWGLDHGTWSVLAHVFPEADIPVVQLSVDASKTIEQHMALGASLSPLLDEGVMVMASGNVVHNLGALNPALRDEAAEWARAFDAATTHVMTTNPGDLGSVVTHPAFDLAVPTPDHFLPLAYIAGIADSVGETAQVLIEGGAMGSLTMTSYTVGTFN